MQIGFGIARVSGTTSDPTYELVDVVSDYDSIKAAESNGLAGHSLAFFSFIRCLSLNGAFVQAVLSARKALGLPQGGLPFRKYVPFSKFARDRKKIIKYFQNIRFAEKFSYPNQLQNCIYDIVFYNLVSPFSSIQSPITHSLEPTPAPEAIIIGIHAPTTKNALHKYIDLNWDDIAYSLRHLDKKHVADFPAVRPIDFEIVELRDKEKLTFSKITDRLQEKYGQKDYNSRINEDSIKTSYARTKKKISEVFRPKH